MSVWDVDSAVVVRPSRDEIDGSQLDTLDAGFGTAKDFVDIAFLVPEL